MLVAALVALIELFSISRAQVPPAPTVTCDAGGLFAFGVGVDCRVDLGPDLDIDDLYSAGLLDQNGEFWPCEIEPDELLCRNIGQDRYDLGVRQLDLEVLDEFEGTLRIDDVATIEWSTDAQPVLFTYVNTDEPVVFEGRTLPIEFVAARDIERTFVVVRDRFSGDEVDRIEVSSPGRDRLTNERLTIDAPPGRYRIWPCTGASELACEEFPAGFAVQVIDPELLELIPGHNRPSAERINIVFAGSRLGSTEALVEIATSMLTMDGPVSSAFDLHYGPMSIEPLASNRHRFNFWYLANELADEGSLQFDGDDIQRTQGFDLDNIQFSVLYGPGYGPSDARLTSLWNSVQPPRADQLQFGSIRVSVDVDDPMLRATTLTHEWGHGLFELRDEYAGFDDRSVLTQYPNCAPSAELAEEWWGSLDGQIDPFVYEVLRARRASGIPGEPREGLNLAESVRVGVFSGGCYDSADALTAFRPSQDSLMNSEIPVFGTVNRTRVEQVLARFSGRGPLDDLDTVDMTCVRRSGIVECAGVLDRFIDPPERRVALDGNSCELTPPLDDEATDDSGLATIACTTASTSGDVVLVMGDQRRSFEPELLPEPEPIADLPIDDRPVGEPRQGRSTWPLVGAGVLMGFVLVRAGRATWRRQK